MVLHTSSKASPGTKRTLPGKHPWNWTFLPCKAAWQPNPCLGLEGLTWRGSRVRAPWRAGETPAAEHLCCMTGPRMPGNRQLPKTSDISCLAPSLRVQSCESSLAATYDSHNSQVPPQTQLARMLFATRGQHVVSATSYCSHGAKASPSSPHLFIQLPNHIQ